MNIPDNQNQYGSYYPAFFITIIILGLVFYFTWKIKTQGSPSRGIYEEQMQQSEFPSSVPAEFLPSQAGKGMRRPRAQENSSIPFSVYKGTGNEVQTMEEDAILPPPPFPKTAQEIEDEKKAEAREMSEEDKEIEKLVGFKSETIADLINKEGRALLEEAYRKTKENKDLKLYDENEQDITEIEETEPKEE